jgi:hypothetical protein
MTASKVALAPLLCLCCIGHAQRAPIPGAPANPDWTELSSLTFTPRPISDDSLLAGPVEPRPGVEQASGQGGRGGAAAGDAGPEGPESSERLMAAIGRRAESIDAEASVDGSRSRALIEELTSLAGLHEEMGDHFLAIEALERALHIRRVNDGLYTLEQVDIVERLIANRTAAGQHAETRQLERYVLELTRRNAGDPRVPNTLIAAADRELDAFYRLLDEGTPWTIDVSLGAGPSFRREGSYTAVSALRSARRNYGAALSAGLSNGTYGVPRLMELQDKIIETHYLAVITPDLDYYGGSGALAELRARVSNLSNFGGTPSAVAGAMMAVGDWYLLQSRNSTALKQYRAAYELLAGQNVAPDTIEEVMSFDVPRTLPVYTPSPRNAAAGRSFRGYIDASFEITKYGVSKDIEVLERSAGTSEDIERRLKRHVLSSRFRPMLADGRVVDSGRVFVRYYYDY